MSDTAYVGDVRRPKIEVEDPDTGDPITLPSAPSVRIIAPSHSEIPDQVVAAVEDEHDATAWEVKYELTVEGPWRVVVTTPAPFKDVEVDSVYANPTRE